MMYTRVAITCDECGYRQVLERRFGEPGEISIVCHDCELPLVALLDLHHPPQARGAYGSAPWIVLGLLVLVGTLEPILAGKRRHAARSPTVPSGSPVPRCNHAGTPAS
jgi:hypothetical protein